VGGVNRSVLLSYYAIKKNVRFVDDGKWGKRLAVVVIPNGNDSKCRTGGGGAVVNVFNKNVSRIGNCCNWSNGGGITCLPPPKSPRLVAGCQRKSTADSQQLQNDLRRLLNADSKENLFEATSVSVS